MDAGVPPILGLALPLAMVALSGGIYKLHKSRQDVAIAVEHLRRHVAKGQVFDAV